MTERTAKTASFVSSEGHMPRRRFFMLAHLGKVHWKEKIRFYGIILGVCLILAAGINALMDQGPRDKGESEPFRSLKSEMEEYRKAHGDKAKREDLVRIWTSYEGKLRPEEIERLKREYRTKLDPADAETLKKAHEDMKGTKR
jgi:hypothetical protein